MSLRLDPDPRAHPGPGVETFATDPFSHEPPDFHGEPAFSPWQPPDDATGALRITAVLVAHDGAPFLPRTLDAIEAQTRPVDQLIAVDAGSLDGGGDLLALATRRLLRLNRDTSFGDAVQAALTALDAQALSQGRPATAQPGSRMRPAAVSWLWLLHDDSAPAPDTLERLIEAAEGGPSIGIAGCKQVSWDDGARLLDVGFTTSRLGARVTGIDVDDLDQGQLDHRSDVLAVGTAGMLIRRDVWDQLGGPDPALAHARDDLDLCRRAHLAGLRVVVVPGAVIAHAAATASGRRGPAGRASWALRDRRAAIHLRLATVPLVALPLLIGWLALAAVLRAVVRLALKQPQRAVAELIAYPMVLTRPAAWLRARRRVRAGRKLPQRDFRRLLAGPRPALRQRRDSLSSFLRTQEQAWSAPTPPAAVTASPAVETPRATTVIAGQPSSEPPAPTEDDDYGVAFDDEREPRKRRPGTRIGVAVAVLAGATGLVGLRLLLSGSGIPLGPALIPTPATAGGLWQLAGSGWRPSGLGLAATADPFDTVLAVLAWPLAGSSRIAVELLLLGGLPFSALLAWWAAGGVTRSRALRAWAALGWAAAPALLTAVAAGRLDAIVVHLALPPAGLALARTIGVRPAPGPGERTLAPALSGRGRGSISAASWAGLLFTVLFAAAPSLALPGLLALLVTAVLGRSGRALLGWVVAVPAVLLWPWWLAVAQQPGLLIAEPGGASTALAGSGVWSAALWPADPAVLHPGTIQRLAHSAAYLTALGDVQIWLRAVTIALAVPLIVLGLSALLRVGSRPAALGLWLIGLAGLAVAVLAPVLDTRGDGLAQLHGWPGPGISLLTLMLLTAALVRFDGAALRLRSRSLGVRHWLAVGTGVVAVIAPILILAGWAVDGWSATPATWVHRGAPDVLPAVATAEAEGPAATRTLVLKMTSRGVRWVLYRAGGPQIGQDSAASLALPPARSTGTAEDGDRPMLAAIGGLLSGAGTDERARLSDLDVGSVLLLSSAGTATATATAALDTSPGLVRVATPADGVLWRVQLDGTGGGPTRPARVRVLSAAGQVLSTLPSGQIEVHTTLAAGPARRVLVLAERADPGWRAWLNGTRLTATTHDGWAQAFTLPAAGGTLTVRHVTAEGQPIDLARLIIVGLALLAAVPLPRRRPRLRPPPRALPAAAAPMPIETVGRRTRLPSSTPAQFVDPAPVVPEPVLAQRNKSVPLVPRPTPEPKPVAVQQPLLPPIWDVDPAELPVEADDPEQVPS